MAIHRLIPYVLAGLVVWGVAEVTVTYVEDAFHHVVKVLTMVR